MNKVTIFVYFFYKENKIIWFLPSIRICFKGLKDLILTNKIDPSLFDGTKSNSSLWKIAKTWTTTFEKLQRQQDQTSTFGITWRARSSERLWRSFGFAKSFSSLWKPPSLNDLQELFIYSASLIGVREF